MGARPYYKRYPSDFITGCIRMTLEEKGAYSMIIDMIFDDGGPIDDDPQGIARVCGCSVRKWKALLAVLIEKGKVYITTDGRISSFQVEKRLEKEAKEAREFPENGAKGGQKSAENKRKAKELNGLAQKGLEENPTENPSILIPIPIPIPDSALHALDKVESNSDADQPTPTVTHIRDRMPRLTDPPGVWMKLMPHLPWSIANAAGVKEPMVGAGENWVLLIPACQAICAAALIHDPDWRGDWNTVEQWVRQGLSIGSHVIPAIEEQVRNFGERYQQPHHLSAFTGAIRRYAARSRAAA